MVPSEEQVDGKTYKSTVDKNVTNERELPTLGQDFIKTLSKGKAM